MAIVALNLTESQQRRAVPVHGLSLELFGAQVGSIDLANQMIRAGWIYPCCLQPKLYDAGDIAACWSRILNGEHPRTHKGGGAKRNPVDPRK